MALTEPNSLHALPSAYARAVTSLIKCDGDRSGAVVRGLLAGGALPHAGVPEEGPIDYGRLARWLFGPVAGSRPAGRDEGADAGAGSGASAKECAPLGAIVDAAGPDRQRTGDSTSSLSGSCVDDQDVPRPRQSSEPCFGKGATNWRSEFLRRQRSVGPTMSVVDEHGRCAASSSNGITINPRRREQFALAAPQMAKIIKVNVGGLHFDVARSTLAACPESSVLRELLLEPTKRLFIDRDGRNFHHILSYLRSGPEGFQLPDSPDTAGQIYNEAIFYGINELALEVKDSYRGAALPFNETKRLEKLNSLKVMFTDEHDPVFDGMTQAIGLLLQVPIVFVSLVAKDRQWFKSRCGLDACSTNRNASFCAMTFAPENPVQAEMLVIEDAAQDKRVCNNPLVIGPPHIRFYAGSPLVTSDGLRLGALCAIDSRPRQLMPWQAQLIANFSHLATQELERHQLLSSDLVDADRDLDVPSMEDFAAGPVRLNRMREALDEVVCLVHFQKESGECRMLYANVAWDAATGAAVRVPEGGRGGLEDAAGLPSFWKFFRTEGRSASTMVPPDVLEGRPRDFALSGRLSTPRSQKPAFCRFVPAIRPLDPAAAVVKTVARSDGNGAHDSRIGSDVYFVLMALEQSGSSPRPGDSLTSPVSSAPSAALTSASGAAVSSQLRSCIRASPSQSPFPDVTLISKLGEGTFGKVYSSNRDGHHLAVRVIGLRDRERSRALQRSLDEHFSRAISHPNVVQTLKHGSRMRGEKSTRVVLEQQADDIFQATPCANAPSIIEVWILQEWCDWGTLEGRFLGQVWSPSKTPELVSVYSEIALAGAYLHSQGILLGGLRARKVLLKSSPCPKGYISKVCDLRLVRLSLQDEACQEDLRSAMSSQADVHDAAVLMCFLIHGEQLNLELPEDLPLCFQKLIRLSLAAELDQRPVFHQLANTLRMA